MYVIYGRIALAALASVLLLSGSAEARQFQVITKDGSTAVAQNTNLPLLEKLNWDPAQRGPLLIIAPDWKNASDGEAFFNFKQPPQLGEPGPNGYKPADLFAYMDRKEMPVGSLTIAAPLNQYVLRYTNLPEPDIWQGVSQDQRLKFLLGTLTAEQWQQLMSENGLGISDLNRTQKPLFTGAFPAGMQILRTEPASDPNQIGKTTNITPSQMDAVRLRLMRRLKWSYIFQGEKNSTLSIGSSPQTSLDGKPTYWIQYPPEEQEQGVPLPKLYGVDLMPAQPNRLKASDIDFALPALDLPVSIAGVKQVGDLIDRLKAATGLELYADIRIAELPVYCRIENGNVRSGDLMKALALGAAGTYRRVSDGSATVYILTDDRVGLGTRQAIIGDWARRAGLQIAETNKAIAKGIVATNATRTAAWAQGEDRTPSAALLEKMAQPKTSNESSYFPISELPSGAQIVIRAQTADWNTRTQKGNIAGQKTIRTDMVQVSSDLQLCLNLSSGESILLEMNGLDQAVSSVETTVGAPLTEAEKSPSQPLRLSAKTAPERILCVTVKNADQAKQVAQIATAHGLNQVMLTSDLSTSQETIAGWVAAVQKAAPALKVSLRVRPFWVAENLTDREGKDILNYDLNLLGETSAQFVRRRKKEEPQQSSNAFPYWKGKQGYWIDPTDKKNIPVVLQRVGALVATPGISGTYLTDWLPPGYNFSNMEQQSEFDAEGEYGFTPSLRLALVRSASVDPVDLSPYGEYIGMGYGGYSAKSVRMMLPFLPDYGPNAMNMTRNGISGAKMGAKDSYARWNMIRYRKASALRDQIAEAIARKSGNPEVWTESNWGQVNLVVLPGGGLVAPVIDWKEAKANDSLLPEVPKAGFGTAPSPINYLIPFRYYDDMNQKNRGMRGAKRFHNRAEGELGLFLAEKAPEVKSAIPIPTPAKPARGFIIDVSDYSTDEVAEFLSDLSVVP